MIKKKRTKDFIVTSSFRDRHRDRKGRSASDQGSFEGRSPAWLH